MTRNQRLFVALGLLVSLAFLWFAFQGLKPDQFLANLRQANLPLILFAALVYFGAVALISLRWQFLLRAVRHVPLARLIPLVCIGYMGNNVYPFRSGEVLRLWLLQRGERVPLARSATTVVVERIFDGIVMLTFILVAVLSLDVSSPEVRAVASFAAPVFLVALAVFFLLAARPNWLRRLVALVVRFLPGRVAGVVSHLSEEFIAGLEGLRTPAHLAGAVMSSYLSWGVEAVVYWLVANAMQLDKSYVDILLVVGVVNLAGLIPASPGQLGVYEFFVSRVLMAEGVAESAAMAYAVVVHIVIWLPVTVVGFFFLARRGFGLQTVTHARDVAMSDQPSAAG
jgi:uncharacterized protein (TIRG00374 family)